MKKGITNTLSLPIDKDAVHLPTVVTGQGVTEHGVFFGWFL